MTQLSAELRAYLEDRIPKAARDARERFPFVGREDFEQEMWLRACVSATRFTRLHSDGDAALIYNELRRACYRLGMKDDRDRRARKAVASGYKLHDEYFYQPKMVGHLISELIQSEWDLPFAMARATKGTDLSGTRVQSGDDTHDSFMNYLVLLTDIKAAWEQLSGYQRDILTKWYDVGSDEHQDQDKWDREAIAFSMGLTYDALNKRKERALNTLIRKLGGEDPYIKKSRGDSDAQ